MMLPGSQRVLNTYILPQTTRDHAVSGSDSGNKCMCRVQTERQEIQSVHILKVRSTAHILKVHSSSSSPAGELGALAGRLLGRRDGATGHTDVGRQRVVRTLRTARLSTIATDHDESCQDW